MAAYILHIGPHKTGSTYLQATFGILRAYLNDRGIVYPSQWQDGPGHADLVRRLKVLDQSLVAEFADLNKIPDRTVLLSAEDLSDLRSTSIQYLSECIDGRDTIVIYYCRRWSELLASGWQEMVKHGEIMTLAEFVAAHLVNIHASRILNYDLVLRPYAEVFGKENLRLVSYSQLVDCEEDLVTNFLGSFLEIHEAIPHEKTILNASMGTLESELIRSLNSLQWSANEARSARAYRSYIRAKANLDLQMLFDTMERSKRRIRMNESAVSLVSLHQQLVQDYGERLVPPIPDRFLFKPRIVEMPYVGCEYLMCDGVMTRLIELREQLNRTDCGVIA
jgi:hypothetical protein